MTSFCDPLPALDAAAVAATLPLNTSALVGRGVWASLGRTAMHWVLLPYRLVKITMVAAYVLAKEISTRSPVAWPRIVLVLSKAWICHMTDQLTSITDPFLCGLSRLIPARNLANLESASLITQAPVTVDPYAQRSLVPSYQTESPITLSNVSGMCWGGCLWFAALYKALEKRCADPETRLQHVARIFSEGAPAQSVALQAIALSRPSLTWSGLLAGLLDYSHYLRKDEMRLASLLPLSLGHVTTIRKEENTFDAIKPGMYLIRINGGGEAHEMLFIKLSQNLSYSWDLNYGLFVHDGPQHGEAAYERLIGSYAHEQAWATAVKV